MSATEEGMNSDHPLKEALSGIEVDILTRRLLDKADKSKRGVKASGGARANNAYTPSVADAVIYDDMKERGVAPLEGGNLPEFRIVNEKPEHRFLVYLFAQGLNIREVFEQLGGKYDEANRPISGTGQWSYAYLTQIRRQPWFESRLLTLMQEQGVDKVQAKLELELFPSLEVVKELRDDHSVAPATRLNAANSLIDRFLGKPIQHVKSESVSEVHTFEHDVEKLEREILDIEAQIQTA